MVNNNRRKLLRAMAGASLTTPLFALSGCTKENFGLLSNTKAVSTDPWQQADEIRARIKLPTIPKNEFVITDFGAVDDGQTNCGDAIRKAIQAATKLGGGRIIVPNGEFKTGPIHLDDHIELHLEDDAILSFLPDPDLYLPAVFTRWEGVEFMGLSPLIYAFNKTDVAVTGNGKLKGGADETHWWPWKGPWKGRTWKNPEQTQKAARTAMFADAENGVPPEQRVYAKDAYIRPPFIQLYRCKNILLEDITINDSPFWLINPVLSSSITVRGVTCNSYGPNNDGCNPESCTDVLIENCLFDTGDDCIAIKSGRNADGRRINKPSQNIVVANCNMKAGHGGVVMGSELSGGIRNVFVENCRMSSPNLWSSIRIKTNAMRGGGVTNLNVRDIEIGTVRDLLLINYYYEEGDKGDFMPTVAGLNLERITCQHAQRVLNVRGFPHAKIKDIFLNQIQVEKVDKPSIVENVSNLNFSDTQIGGKAIKTLSDLATEAAS